MSEIYDVVVQGGGPSGLTALLYAVRFGLKAILIEENPYGCGQISLTERVDNYPGLFGISGYDLGEKFIESAVSNGGVIEKGKIESLEKIGDFFKTTTVGGKEYLSKTVIVSLGSHHRKLGIEGEEKFTAHGVSYCAVCDAAFFKGRTVAVIGGGDTALSDALTLSNFASKVYLVHRRGEFRGSKMLENKVRSTKNIELILNSKPLEILGDKSVSNLKLDSASLEVNGVFVAIGEEPNSDIFKRFLRLDERGYIITDEDLNTSVSGVFASGDIRVKTLRQVITASADGALAAFGCQEFITRNFV